MAKIHCESCDGERRDFLKNVGKAGIALGVMGLSVGSRNFMQEVMGQGATPTNEFYDCALQIFFTGGPTSLDVWDPKPGSRNNFVGTINLGAKDPYNNDVLISEVFPTLAASVTSDPLVGLGVFRSMVHRNNSHGNAQRYMNNFWEGAPSTMYPSTAAVMSYYYQGAGIGIPSVVINGNNGQNANVANQSRVPTALQVNAGSGQGANPTVQALELPPGVDATRYQRRQALITKLNQRFLSAHPDAIAAAYKKATDDAAAVTMKGDAARAFDLTGVPLVPARNNGDSQRLTQAVRLLEAGVPYVACGIGGNDTHGNNVQAVQNQWGMSINQGVSEIITRLKGATNSQGNPLRCLIIMGGEFGRTPNSVNNATLNNQTIANANLGRNGRDHWGDSFSWAVVSVNQPKFKTGAYGFTGPDGNWREQNNDPATQTVDPVHPRDLGAFVYRSLGFQVGLDVAYDVPLTDREAPPVDRINISTKLMQNFGLV